MNVIILSGISGSGKSTFAKFLKSINNGTCAIVSADDYFINDRGEYVFDPSKLKLAHDACKAKFDHHIGIGTELIIVDNTNTEPWEFGYYLQACEMNDIHCSRIIVDGCIHQGENVHGVPSNVMENQKRKLIKSIS